MNAEKRRRKREQKNRLAAEEEAGHGEKRQQLGQQAPSPAVHT